MFGIGSNDSSTKTSGTASSVDSSVGISNQSVFGSDLFNTLYGGAMGASGQVAQKLPTFQGDAQSLFSGGTDFLSSLKGDAGSDYMGNRLSGSDNILQQQISGLGSDLGKFYNEQLLPGIASESIGNGMLGGGRDQIAQGTAAGEVARQFGQGVTALRSANQGQLDTLATNYSAGRTAAAGVGLGNLSNVLGLSEANLKSDMLPSQLMAQILGGPTTLTDSLQVSSGSSQAENKTKGKSSGFTF
jgi:hypothetical protein